MDQLIKLRGSYRGTFTKLTDKIKDFLKSETLDLDSCASFLAQLQGKYSKVEQLDKDILKELPSEENYSQKVLDDEIESVDNYNSTFIDLKTKLERRLNSTSDLNRTVVENETNSKRNFKLPKIELQKFDGNLKDWLSFWGLFEKIHEDVNISEVDKFQYLLQSTQKGSRAREVVESFPVTAENYQQAVDCLRARFGREDVLVEVYVRELLSLVLSNTLGQEHKLPIVKLYDRLETQLRSLKMLGVTSDKYASMLYPLVESSLPIDLLRIWERHLNSVSLRNEESETEKKSEKNSKPFNKLETLMNFLHNEIQGEEKINLAISGFGFENKTKRFIQNKSKVFPNQNKAIPTGMELLTSYQGKQNREQECVFCDKPHPSAECKKVANLTYEQRKQNLLRRGGCFKCLKLNHISSSCRSKANCTICGNPHHTLLCRNNIRSTPNAKGAKSDKVTSVEDQVLASVSATPSVLLQTLVIILRGENKDFKIRAIVDSASQRSYILDSTAEKVGYKPIRTEKMKHSLFGGSSTDTCEHNVYKAYLSDVSDNYRCNFDVLNQPTICQTMPPVTQQLCEDDLSVEGICLEDCPGPIELLIGADVAGKLMTGRLKRLKSGLTAVETKLGWTVLGRTRVHSEQTENLVVTSMLTRDVRITDLWELDSLGIKDPAEKQSKEELEEASEKHFVETLSRDNDGRYVVSLPWIEGRQTLPNNKTVAERRLKSTVEALRKKGLIEDYQEVFNQWLDEKIIEEVKHDELEKTSCHYLPHRAVVKEHSTTTIRPVFDASAKVKNSFSLNDCLAKGPNYIELIPSILNKFRLSQYGVVADIRKAFLQIGINEKDCDFLRFLWWEMGDPHKMRIFRHRRVVFGVNSSPFLLGATLNYHLSNVPDYLQETASKLKKAMYVDNCVTSCDSEEEVINFIKQSKEIMSSACFDLRGWIGNGLKPETFGIPEGTLPEKTVSVLGLNWNISEDTLYSDPKFDDYEDINLSKRIVLSLASRIFDPIGFLCPVTLIPKLLMQECWRRKLPWDDRLPSDLEKKFLRWKSELKFLKTISIPRRVLENSDLDTDLSFHVFCDASQQAFATCIYLRQENDFGVRCQLVQARARVAPLKSVSIPRLELLACCLGVRLMSSIKKDFPFDIVRIFYWTDSMNALFWIKNPEAWGVFVMNRVNEIRSLSNPDDWKFVPGSLNPADLPSRGCNADVLIKCHWWEGPEFLKTPPSEWPKRNVSPEMQIVNSERKKSVISALNDETAEKFYERYSSYLRILRITAWMYRFISNLRNHAIRTSGELSNKEMKQAEIALLKIVQREEFHKGIEDRLRKLHPVVDKEGLFRVKSLILRSKDSTDFRLPIILPGNHYIVQRLIEWKHKELNHAGVQILMNHLREKYWILRCRKSIRQVTLRCVRCRRFAVNSVQPEAPALPEDRIRDAAPFEVTGVDLAGPLHLRDGRKCWIVLYTCAVYRAVHLELLTSLSSEAFLQTLRRFIARRGRPSVIYSDQGKNFCGASKLFTDPAHSKIRNEALVKNITWKFNPPAAPWWGGWWERLIGCTKQILRRILGRASLEFEELYTIICDIESLMNSRPLTTISEDTEDLVPLTPSMFLQGIRETGLPDLDNLENVNLKGRLRYLLKLKKDLRSRFRVEYLGQLKNSKGVAKNDKKIAVGDVVLVGHDNQKRINWPLAKIIEVYPGKDGAIRVAKIKTGHGVLVRPVQRLYPLELSPEEGSDILKKGASNGHIKPPRTTSKRCLDTSELSRSSVPHTVKKTDSVMRSDENPRVSRKGRLIKIPDRLNL